MPKLCFLETNSFRQTKKFAGLLASVIAKGVKVDEAIPSAMTSRNALVFALTGNLGTGKTTFVQGFLRSLSVRRKITSPTFVIIKKYKIRANSRANSRKFASAYHIDCYRINSDLAERRGKQKELSGLGLKEILNNPENIVLIEWPERIKKILPKDSIWIKFKYGEKENIRKIIIR